MLGPFALVYSVLAAYPAILDAVKLAVLGLFLDQARRAFQRIWTSAQRGLELTVRVNDSDDSYDWIRHYLSTHCMDPKPAPSSTSWFKGDSILQILLEEVWPRGRVPPRDVQISVIKKRHFWEDEGPADGTGAVETHMAPSFGTKHYLQFQNYTIRFGVHQTQMEWGFQLDWITMSAMFAPHSLFTDLIATAHREFLIQDHGKLRIFTPRRGGDEGWRKTTTKPHRPWDSVILPGNIKDDILQDTREFLVEGPFYRKRGLPYRRGYLLYGAPGAGKSSLIAALAAELKLDIYIVNLSAKSLDDSGLSKLLRDIPSRAILLMEDIDCALNDREGEDASDSDSDEEKPKKSKGKKKKSKGGVTLSGLLNALDGVASSEGRLLFCTTNHVDQIDAALSRPGRCDFWIEFTHATKSQIVELFVHFYHPGSGYLLSGNDLSLTTSRSFSSHNSRILSSPQQPDDTATEDGKSGQKTPANALSSSPVIVDAYPWLSSPDSVKFAEMLSRLDNDTNTNILELAMRFAAIIPDYAVSVSGIQGYLLRYKRKPEDAVDGAKAWVKAGYPQGPGAKVKVETEHEEESVETSVNVTPAEPVKEEEDKKALDTSRTNVTSAPTEAKSPAKSFGKWVKTGVKKEKA